jgi:hypothetical protein
LANAAGLGRAKDSSSWAKPGSGDRPHSGLISFVTNIDFVRIAAIRDILPDRILEIYPVLAATYLGMMILLCSGMSKFWAIGAIAQRLRGSNLMGEGEGIDFFIVISDLFKVGIVCEGVVDGLGDAAGRLVASWQKPKSKIWLLVEVISKITDGSQAEVSQNP